VATSKSSLLKPDEGVPTPELRTSFDSLGYSGLKVAMGRVYEEMDTRLRFPQVLKEIDAMSADPMISAALHRYTMMIGSRTWNVKAPKGASKKTQERAAIIDSMRDDMQDQTWGEFISEASSFIKYGFSLHELVLYRRLKAEGSRYNDGLVGIKGIPSRSQSTMHKWLFDENMRTLVGWEQSTANLKGTGNLYVNVAKLGTEIPIPIKTADGQYKTLLFNADARNGNPEGKSPLLASWTAFKMKQLVQQSELDGISRDLGGVVNISAPAKIMAADASEGDKATFEYLKNIARNFHNNAQAGIVLPSDCNPEDKTRYYNLELLAGQGSKGFQINEVINRLNQEILTPLCAEDALLGGTSASGSNALAASKDSKIAMAIEHRLKEMQRILNQHLIPTLYKANGWDLAEELPTFEYSELDPDDSEEWSKMGQRYASVGMLEKSRYNLNVIAKRMGFEERPDDEPVDESILTMSESKSGAGFQSPTSNGTAKKPTGTDTSSNNQENKG